MVWWNILTDETNLRKESPGGGFETNIRKESTPQLENELLIYLLVYLVPCLDRWNQFFTKGRVLFVGPFWDPFGITVGPRWDHVDSQMGQVGPNMVPIGPRLKPYHTVGGKIIARLYNILDIYLLLIILVTRFMYLVIYRGHIWAHLSCT